MGHRKSLIIVGVLVSMTMLIALAACASTQGPAGLQGPQGPEGPLGPAGPTGPSGKSVSLPPGPGLNMQISKAEITADNKPVVTFKVTDAQGNLLKNSDLDANSLRFTIAKVVTDKDSGLTSYENYITRTVTGGTYTWYTQTLKSALPSAVQATTDAGGKLVETDAGFTYVFTNTVPANFDKTATTVVGGQVTRNNRTAVANATFAFVPSGATPNIREVVKTDACNQCHDPLTEHGARVQTGYCVTCHSPQSTDVNSGNTIDFKVMVHKIHSGATLPSVKSGKPFFINTVDFSKVGFPREIRNCTTCHQPGTNNPDNWKTAPNAAACTACHDDVDVRTGKNHPGGPQPNDVACKGCHVPDSGKEFDASIVGAHVIPNDSKQLRGVKFAIVSVSDSKPGQKPTVTFNIKDKDGKTIDPKDMDSLSLVLAGPTTDYAKAWSESLVVSPTVSSKAKDAGGGNYLYTFDAAIPSDTIGSYAVSMMGYINTRLKKADGSILMDPGTKLALVVRDAGYNPVFYFAVTDTKAVPRRLVIDRANCNKCHRDIGNPAGFAIHGGTRMNTELCVMCHNPNGTDEAQRPADKGIPSSIEFDHLIQSIHRGQKRTTPFVVYGFGGTPNDFSEIAYPGNLQHCEKCHAPGTNLLPIKKVLPMTVTQKGVVVSVTQPTAAACLGCHDSAPAKAHIAINTASDKTEVCIVCHAEGRVGAVSNHGK